MSIGALHNAACLFSSASPTRTKSSSSKGTDPSVYNLNSEAPSIRAHTPSQRAPSPHREALSLSSGRPAFRFDHKARPGSFQDLSSGSDKAFLQSDAAP